MNQSLPWRDTDVPVADPDVCSAILDGEGVLYHPISARSVLLNTSLTAVWAAVDGVADVVTIAQRLAQRFAAPIARVRADVEAGLAALEAEGFLKRVSRVE